MFSRTWNTSGLYKYSKERQRSGRSRARRSVNFVSSDAVIVPTEPAERLAGVPATRWQCLLQAAKTKRDVLVMLGHDRAMARKEAIDSMAEDRLRAMLRMDFNR